MYPQTSPTAFSPTTEGFPASERDLFAFPIQPENQYMTPTFPTTPGASTSDFQSSPPDPLEGAYVYHSPEFTYQNYNPAHEHNYRMTRPQPTQVNYSPPLQQRGARLEPAPVIREARHYRRSSSAVHFTEGNFVQSGFRCEWKGCRYPGAFGRKFELKRHVDTQHISPNSFECPDSRCRKSYNRKDNLEEHLRRAHCYDI
ncbi:hypothetical protein N7478_011852 [Penicillium angulare]|uniref:uncharacterized protein n=1 Tax=Penicillium angulare TaxID=116970 RepID=UPI002540F46B|nr:uncharacterized protein N7478_011852 [Penicillium angulare]KAJ5261257.1 hypothetical protein N7478_011852 [Penicillium angulare]